MFAIIKTGGKQYKVAANDIIKVEKLLGASGDTIEFSDVLMMGQGDSVKVGAPLVSNAKVCGTVLDQIRDDKVIIFKKKRRHNYRRKNGHRQYLTVVRITDILADGSKAKTASSKPEVEKGAEKKVAPKSEAKPADKKTAPKAEVKAPAKKAAPKTKKTSKE
ncbi:MAG: 50S ribosomal protein L21 [Proteobacteria bacterium]|nr:50S ribosomal protein L21 [Pseudomonadota bacterium]